MIKKQELLNPKSCLNKAAPNEPIFVLRGKDPMAPMTVRQWAAMASGHHEPEKLAEAETLAQQMESYRARSMASGQTAEHTVATAVTGGGGSGGTVDLNDDSIRHLSTKKKRR